MRQAEGGQSESQGIGKTDLRKVQNHKTEWQSDGYL
jgi:hypothetical protein